MLPWRVRAAVLARSFAVQGSWNYRTLLGAGFAFALLPVLRYLYRDDPERLLQAVERHSGLFNSHPYLAPMALGAVASLEEEGAPPPVVDRFKSAIRGSLGTLGDRLVWAGWRPVCLLLALTLLVLDQPWWVAVAAFLIIYNAGHLAIRVWSFRVGLDRGIAVGEQLRHSSVPQMQRVLSILGAFLVGVLVPLAASGRLVGASPALPWSVAALLAALVGVRFGGLIRIPVVVALAGFALLGFILRMVT